MQILEYADIRRPEARARCLAHPHVFGRRLGVILYQVGRDGGPTIAQAAEAVATSYVPLIPARDPGEVLWLQAWPEAAPGGGEAGFLVVGVAYRWRSGRARSPLWYAVEPAVAATARGLWYRHGGPALAAATAAPLCLQR